MELWEEIINIKVILEKSVAELKERGIAMAKTEKDYRVKLAHRTLVLRNEGYPVTVLGDIVRGEEEVAELRYKRDVAEALYKSCLEGINVYKLNLKILESQYQREWGSQ